MDQVLITCIRIIGRDCTERNIARVIGTMAGHTCRANWHASRPLLIHCTRERIRRDNIQMTEARTTDIQRQSGLDDVSSVYRPYETRSGSDPNRD